MRRKLFEWQIGLVFFFNVIGGSLCAMTMKQLVKTMDMMRGACAPKFKISIEELDGLRKGVFDDNNKEMRCYTLCIAQIAGTVTKKNEISLEKTIKQMQATIPLDLQQPAIDTAIACKDVQKQYKDLCDKTYYSTKCAYDQQPDLFLFP